MKLKRIRLSVTANDIAAGWPRREALCPVARALRRVVKPKLLDAVYVNRATAYFRLGTVHYEAELPANMKAFVQAFDSNQPVQPFHTTLTFVISNP